MFEFSSAQTFMGHRFLRDEFYFFEPKWVHTGILLNYYTKAKTYIKSCVKYAIILQKILTVPLYYYSWSKSGVPKWY